MIGNRVPLLSLLLMLACAAWANVNVGRYDAVYIVPAMERVTIDGNLAEWDRSGEFYTYRFEEQKQTHYFQGYMMYDEKFLYLGAHVGDTTPMMNQYAPEAEATVAWRGDCLQVRLSSDPALGWPLPSSSISDRIAHLTLWYYTPKAQPCLQIQYGMDYHGEVVNPVGYQGGYKKDADGKGYTLEYAIAWKLLQAAANPPKAGDCCGCTWQMLWSDQQGRAYRADLSEIRNPNDTGFVYQSASSWGKALFLKTGNLPKGTVGARDEGKKVKQETGFYPIAYHLPGKGKAYVSMHIEDAGGRTVRWLLGEAERNAGKNLERWNGLDNDGNPVPAGKYTVRWCYHRGIAAKMVAVADNGGAPPYNTGDNTGSWAGDYGTPVAVTASETHVFLAHESGEASRILIKVTPAGQRVWGVDTTLDLEYPVIAICNDGASLYVLQGRAEGGTRRGGVVKISAENGFNQPIGTTGRSYLVLTQPAEHGGMGVTTELSGIAVNRETIFVSSAAAGKILCLDKMTGKQVNVLADLDSPRGLAVGPDGKLYALCGTTLVRMHPDGGARQVLVRDLYAPRQVAVAKNGEIFISVQGNRHQVLRYAPDGKLLNALGRPGGMPVPGPWVKEAMRNPLGVCVAPNGNIWVAEGSSNPKRTSVWSSEGRFITEYLGPCPYSSTSLIDPEEPGFVYSSNTKFRIDAKTGKTTPAAVVFDPLPAEYPPRHRSWPRFAGISGYSRFIHLQGRTFLASSGGGLLYERVGDRLVGLVALGRGNIGITGPGAWAGERNLLGIDRNLDGRITEPETQFIPVGGLYWGSWVGDNLDLYLSDERSVWRIPCEGFAANGVPNYVVEHAQLRYTFDKEVVSTHPGAVLLPFREPLAINHVMLDSAGNVYLLLRNNDDRIRRDQAFLDKGHRLVKFSPDGTLRWEYRNIVVEHAPSRNTVISKPGEIIGAIHFAGDFGRYLTLDAYYGQYIVVDKETGLFITAFTPDTRNDPPLNELTILTENFNGAACYVRKPERYLFCGGDANARVFELNGLTDVAFGAFPIIVSSVDHQRAVEAVNIEFAVNKLAKSLMARPLAVRVDGDLADWEGAEWGEFGVDAGRKARVAAAWSTLNGVPRLQVAFNVTDDSPLLNRGGNTNLLFKSGDAVEVCLSSVEPGRERKDETPLPGDQRLLITLVNDTPVVMRYEPKSTRPGQSPATFSSPTGQEVFEHVAPLATAQAACMRRAGGYSIEASFDVRDLGLSSLEVGRQLRADFGVLFSDKGGAFTLVRAMWSDDHHEIGVTNDIPTESRLHPKRWGWLVLR